MGLKDHLIDCEWDYLTDAQHLSMIASHLRLSKNNIYFESPLGTLVEKSWFTQYLQMNQFDMQLRGKLKETCGKRNMCGCHWDIRKYELPLWLQWFELLTHKHADFKVTTPYLLVSGLSHIYFQNYWLKPAVRQLAFSEERLAMVVPIVSQYKFPIKAKTYNPLLAIWTVISKCVCQLILYPLLDSLTSTHVCFKCQDGLFPVCTIF